jgi:hypothetical protein
LEPSPLVVVVVYIVLPQTLDPGAPIPFPFLCPAAKHPERTAPDPSAPIGVACGASSLPSPSTDGPKHGVGGHAAAPSGERGVAAAAVGP